MFVLCMLYSKGQKSKARTSRTKKYRLKKWSKLRVCGRSLAGAAGSNPAGDINVCVVCFK